MTVAVGYMLLSIACTVSVLIFGESATVAIAVLEHLDSPFVTNLLIVMGIMDVGGSVETIKKRLHNKK